MRWSRALFLTLIQELHVDEELATYVGNLAILKRSDYPRAIAIALILRHCWRSDDLADLMRRLRM